CWMSLANLFGKGLYLQALILFIKAPYDAKGVNVRLGFAAVGLDYLLIGYIHFKLHIRLVLPEWNAMLLSWKDNFPLFLSGVASYLSVSGGLIILSFFASVTVLGMFSMAEKITMVIRMVPTLITQAVYPNASKLS